ncbi:M16 family metallopeptidase [Ferruginibacter albus]|uniref:M16 family metallopeptidase n=1 Tax=Ferruginibacter albus TaxID=2875540 RepID=UPI001CC3C114|nr:pitrilysin family protein [Ferruginibacter albus]UAY52154.1 insulinase family protein [Ferruginibacter albus]
MIDRTIAPSIKDAVEFDLKLKPYEKFVLDNGVEVYAVDAGVQEVLQLELVLYAGNSFETQNAVATATNYMLKSGTSGKTAFQLNEHFEYYGSFCKRACYNETAVFSLHSLTKHLSHLLPVMSEMLTDSIFPENELSIYKQNTKQALAVSLKKSDFVANRMIDVYLFGKDHPYGKYNNAEDYDALQTEQLKKYYQQYYLNGNCVIFVAGKLPKDLFQQLNNNFGKLALRPKPSALDLLSPSPVVEKKYRLQNDDNGVQGSIRVGRDFPNRHHPDFAKAMVLNSLLGGFFGSRLMSNIREDKGYTYGIYSYLQNSIQQSAWIISTEVGRDVCEPAIKEIYHELKTLQDKLVSDEELLLVRNFMMGSILGDLDGPFQIIGRWKNLILNNLDEQYFYSSVNTIKNITAAEIKQLAEKYFNPQDFYELVVI